MNKVRHGGNHTLSLLTFGPIIIKSARSMEKDGVGSDGSATNCLQKIPVRRTENGEMWSLEPVLISMEVSRPDGSGKIYENVTFTVECAALGYATTYDTKLEIYDGSMKGNIAEMISVEGASTGPKPQGELKISIKCGSSAHTEKSIVIALD